MKQKLHRFLFRSLILLFLLLILPSCGYRSIRSDDRLTLSIPYVRGDEEGFLTAALISELTNTGLYQYVKSNGEIELKVALVGGNEEIIGFRYDRTEKKGRTLRNLMAVENRQQAAAEVTLYRASEDQPILGPIVVTASTEYDYIDANTLRELAFTNSRGKLEKVMNFSQGQLDSIEGAQDNALTPMYNTLAKKIAALIQRSYFEERRDP